MGIRLTLAMIMLFPVPVAASPVIQATRTAIVIDIASLRVPGGTIAVYELMPNQDDDAWRQTEPLLVREVGRRTQISLPRFEHTVPGPRDRIYSKFVLAPGDEDDGEPLMPARFVEDFSVLPRARLTFPETRSKKGLQVQMIDDAIALGVRHAAINVQLAPLVAWEPDDRSIIYRMDGREFHFNPVAVGNVDARVKPLSDAGMVVSLILLNPSSGADTPANRVMRHPDYDPACPNHYSAFNTVTDDGVLYLRAIMEFLVERYTRPDQRYGRALNYIVGNEVNSHWWWGNMGEVDMETYLEEYLRAVRIVSTAARKTSTAARVYISLEHHWTTPFGDNPKRSFPARPFIDRFAERAREQGDFPWHVAHHPYPENLFEPATWNDRSAIDDFDTPRITFRNIHVLTDYFSRLELLYRGQYRHIILSEQGFHTKDGEEGELLQAAAYCYAWHKVADLRGIDAFILHRHVDHGQEGGLRLGLWTRNEEAAHPAEPARPKRLYDVFRRIDTPGGADVCDFALPVIGIESWDELQPGHTPTPATED